MANSLRVAEMDFFQDVTQKSSLAAVKVGLSVRQGSVYLVHMYGPSSCVDSALDGDRERVSLLCND